jgi:hypothetical protein
VNGEAYAYFPVVSIVGDTRILLVAGGAEGRQQPRSIDAANPGRPDLDRVREPVGPVARSRYDQSSGRWAASRTAGARSGRTCSRLQAPLDPPDVVGPDGGRRQGDRGRGDGRGRLHPRRASRLDADPVRRRFPDGESSSTAPRMFDPGSSAKLVGGRSGSTSTRATPSSTRPSRRPGRRSSGPSGASGSGAAGLVGGAASRWWCWSRDADQLRAPYYLVDLAAKRADIIGEDLPDR